MSAWMLMLAVVAQDAVFVETRFERVHLRNGSFVDGRLVKDEKGGVTLSLKAGEMRIRRDQIARIEKVTMRTLAEPSAPPARKAPALAVEGGFADAFAPKPAPAAPRPAADPILARIEAAGDAELPDLTRSLAERSPEELAAFAEGMARITPQARRVLADALRQARPTAAIPALKRHATQSGPDLRAESVSILAAFMDPSLAADLRECLRDEDPQVRGAAIPGLLALEDRESFPALAALCQDPDEGVRARALAGAIALAARHDLRRDLLWSVRDALDRAEGQAKVGILSAIARGNLRELEEAVVRHLDDRDPKVRGQAASTLGRVGSKASADILLSRLASEREYWPRVQLCEAVRSLRLRAAIPELLRWLEDESEQIQMAATRSLRELTGQSFGLDRARWNAWWATAGPKS